MNIQGVEITDEMLKKANECKSAEELIALAKEYGVELTQEQAAAFMEEFTDTELSAEELDRAAGGHITGNCYTVDVRHCFNKDCPQYHY